MKASKVIVIALVALSLNGCAAIMAMSGKHDANTSMLRVGMPRQEVLLHLIEQPVRSIMSDEKRIDVFKLQRGNAPSMSRALGHVAMDILTFGWWEVAGVPLELIQGETFYLTIEYDKDDKVTNFFMSKAEPI